MTNKLNMYEVHIQPVHQFKKNIENNEYECVSCLGKMTDNFKKVLIDPTSKNYQNMAEVYTCEYCLNKTLVVSEKFLGSGNTEELAEYGTVHAEWSNEVL